MSLVADTPRDTIWRLERCAYVIRTLAIIWTTWTVITFAYLALFRPRWSEATIGWPIYLGAAALSLLFLIAMAWPSEGVRSWLDRVVVVLNWQVGAGALIAFSIAVSARQHLFIPFGTYGMYLLLSAFCAAALKLVALALDRRYNARDQELAAQQRQAQLNEIATRIASQILVPRGRFRGWLGRRAPVLFASTGETDPRQD